eukprot:scaffold156_cov173-Ochromonas_danica.AAC.19
MTTDLFTKKKISSTSEQIFMRSNPIARPIVHVQPFSILHHSNGNNISGHANATIGGTNKIGSGSSVGSTASTGSGSGSGGSSEERSEVNGEVVSWCHCVCDYDYNDTINCTNNRQYTADATSNNNKSSNNNNKENKSDHNESSYNNNKNTLNETILDATTTTTTTYHTHLCGGSSSGGSGKNNGYYSLKVVGASSALCGKANPDWCDFSPSDWFVPIPVIPGVGQILTMPNATDLWNSLSEVEDAIDMEISDALQDVAKELKAWSDEIKAAIESINLTPNDYNPPQYSGNITTEVSDQQDESTDFLTSVENALYNTSTVKIVFGKVVEITHVRMLQLWRNNEVGDVRYSSKA